MVEFLQAWQEIFGNLIGGVLTLVAGGLIFLEGSRQRAFARDRDRLQKFRDDSYDVDFLDRLREHCENTVDIISDDMESVVDYIETLDRGELAAPPESFVRKKFFELATMHISGRPINYNITRLIAEVVDTLELYENDFAKFRNKFGGRLVSMSGGEWQPSLAFAASDPRREEAVGHLELSAGALTSNLAVLREATIETINEINLRLQGARQ